MNNDYHISTPKKDSVKAFDPSFDGSTNEYIFAWNENKPMVRPSAMVCPSCNNKIAVSSDPLDAPNCSNVQCNRCGYALRVYGQNDDDLVYDRTIDDADYNESPEYDMENEQPEYNIKYEDANESEREYDLNREYELERDYGYKYAYGRPPMPYNNDNLVESGTDRFEHLSNTSNSGVTMSGLCSYFCCFVILLFIAYYIAYARGEIYNEDGKTLNFSLVACIFFFYQLYFGYALVDWLTRPAHGCPHVTLN